MKTKTTSTTKIIDTLIRDRQITLSRRSYQDACAQTKQINDELMRQNYDWRVAMAYNTKTRTAVIDVI